MNSWSLPLDYRVTTGFHFLAPGIYRDFQQLQKTGQ
jgi:hypothetical protein